MDALVRRLALRNAAKVAFGSLFFGCGGTVTVQDPGDAKADALGDAAVDAAALDASLTDATTDAATDAALACTGPVDVDASTVDTPAFECCLGVVEAVTGDAGFETVDAGTIAADPSLDNCCKAIIAHVDGNSADYSAASPTLPTCCNALGTPVGTACTPWGPPMPPEMSEPAPSEPAPSEVA